MVLPRYQDFLLGTPSQPPTPSVPTTESTNEPVLQLDDGWISTLSLWSGGVARLQSGALKRRGETIGLGSFVCAKQTESDACGIFSLINAEVLQRLRAGTTPSGWLGIRKEMADLMSALDNYANAKWNPLKGAKKVSNGLFFEHLDGTARSLGILVIPPFHGDGLALEYGEEALGVFVAKLKELHAQSGSIVIAGGNNEEQHWRTAVIHRYQVGGVRWEILIADSQENKILAQGFGHHLAKWIDAPDEMYALCRSKKQSTTETYGM